MKDIKIEKVKEFENDFLEYMDMKHGMVLKSLKEGVLTPDMEEIMQKVAAEIVTRFK
jgi:F-type H+-transporting ATPase subunit alpha